MNVDGYSTTIWHYEYVYYFVNYLLIDLYMI